jgi:hypothetical protein
MTRRRKDSQTAKELPFHPDVDPYGNLARLLGTALVHIEENKVSYYERVISDHAGDARYVTSTFYYIYIYSI